jgi:hypothetical protein
MCLEFTEITKELAQRLTVQISSSKMPGFYLVHIKITSSKLLPKSSLPIYVVSICSIVQDDNIIKVNLEEKRMGL